MATKGLKIGSGVRTKINVSIRSGLNKKFLERAQSYVNSKIDRAIKVGENAGGKVIKKYVLANPVIRALLGKLKAFGAGSDLQAEFGLRDSWTTVAVKKIVEVLKKAIDIKQTKKTWYVTPTGAAIEFTISALSTRSYYDKLINGGHPLKYTSYRQKSVGKSRKRSYIINWIKWLLNAQEGLSAMRIDIPSINTYGISYSIPKNAISRSGRAVMIQGETRGKVFASDASGYEAPSAHVGEVTPPRNVKFPSRKVFKTKLTRKQTGEEEIVTKGKSKLVTEDDLFSYEVEYAKLTGKAPKKYKLLESGVLKTNDQEFSEFVKAKREYRETRKKKKFSVKARKVSQKEVDFPYRFPPIAVPKGGEKNFIQDIAFRSNFKKDLKKAVKEAMDNVVKVKK